jgi:hypothetical protein
MAATAVVILVTIVVFVKANTPFARAQTFTDVHNFLNSPDGSFPRSGVVQDTAGILYGTTFLGGTTGTGTAY